MFFFGRETQREYVWGKKKQKNKKKQKQRDFSLVMTHKERVCVSKEK